MSSMHDIIYNSVRNGWDALSRRLYITFMVIDRDGNPVDGSTYPIGHEFAVDNSLRRYCTINISVSACKSFVYQEAYDSFVYDVGANGYPFLGSINPNSVIFVGNPDTNVVYYHMDVQSNHNQTRHIKPTELPKITAHNKHIVPKKSKANLHVVKSDNVSMVK